jgi:hypothetical protein
MVMPIVVASIITGQLVSRIGYYTPFMIFGVCLTAVGAGLLTTLEIDASEGKWIGFQIVYGFGLGSCSRAPNMAAQTVLPREDVAIGASLMFFGQQLFDAVFTAVGQNVLDNQLANRLAGIPGISPRLIQSMGATELLNLIPAEYHAAAVEASLEPLLSNRPRSLAFEMCWKRYKTPACWPNCTGGVGPCSTHDPDHDYVQPCPDAVARGNPCENLTPTSQASSTKRNTNCPNHKNQPKPPPGNSNQGAGGAGGSGSAIGQPQEIRVAD